MIDCLVWHYQERQEALSHYVHQGGHSSCSLSSEDEVEDGDELVLSVSTIAAQETNSREHSTSCDEEIAHIDKLHDSGPKIFRKDGPSTDTRMPTASRATPHRKIRTFQKIIMVLVQL